MNPAWTSAQGTEWALDRVASDSGPGRKAAEAAVAAGVAAWDDDGTDRGGCVAVWTPELAAYAAQMEEL